MNYEELEAAVNASEAHGPQSLYDRVSAPDVLDEAVFFDAVSRNLRTGRIVVMFVGDDTREELQALHQGLQAHAGFRFTFAMVEMSAYESNDGLVVVPRTLLATHKVERGVIQIEDNRKVVAQTVATTKPTLQQPQTLSSDHFIQAMAQINSHSHPVS